MIRHWVIFPIVIIALIAGEWGSATTNAGAGWEGKAAPLQQDERNPGDQQGPYVSEPVTPRLSAAVRDLPSSTAPDFPRLIPDRRNPQPSRPVENITTARDSLAGLAALNAGRTPGLLLNFAGLSNLANVNPPDTIGDVGPDHFVQMVNLHIAIYDKNGVLLSGPIALSTFFSSAGMNCNDDVGDPVILYDPMADRWLLSQFALPNHLCVAISQTPNPTGAFYLYQFNTVAFPDYFKFGVWPDGYYMSANEATYTAYAFDRASMLQGLAATFQKFSGGTNFYLPSDLDGPTLPPAGAPNYFYTFKDNTFHGGSDRLEVYAFDVDWITPANSTLSLAANIPVTSFTYTVCGFFVLSCIPQGGTMQRVDPVSEWPMHRFPYRNFGDHETLIGNFTVDVGSDVAGIRWFELRKSGAGSWTLFQEGTFSPDSNQHWMGSIAMDHGGNIALGYSVSSDSMFPAIRYATRLAGDPLGTFQAEATLIAGTGAQTGSNRWGDYSAMSVDPSDDCTFWYTNEYYPVSSINVWHTRVGAFSLPECSETDLEIVKSAAPVVASPGEPITYTLNAANTGALDLSSSVSITVTDELPAGFGVTGMQSSDWTCGQIGQVVTCTRLGLVVGPAPEIAIIGLAPLASGVITNTATIESSGTDPNPANDSSAAIVSLELKSFLPLVIR